MFARYAAIGVGHDAVHLRRHPHGLVDNHLAADNEEDDVDEFKDPCVSHVSQSGGDVEEEGDEGDEDSDSVSDGSVDSNFEVSL